MTGFAGKMMGKSLHTNYSKNQNNKFPQSVFKIYNTLLCLFVLYFTDDREKRGMHAKFSQEASREGVSSKN
jgi:hypothetical protein